MRDAIAYRDELSGRRLSHRGVEIALLGISDDVERSDTGRNDGGHDDEESTESHEIGVEGSCGAYRAGRAGRAGDAVGATGTSRTDAPGAPRWIVRVGVPSAGTRPSTPLSAPAIASRSRCPAFTTTDVGRMRKLTRAGTPGRMGAASRLAKDVYGVTPKSVSRDSFR